MAADWAIRLVPEPFRDFLPYTSLSALKVIHTRPVLQRSLEIAKRSGSEASRARAAESLAASLTERNLPIRVARSAVAPLDVSALDSRAQARMGAAVLGLYFHQIQTQGPWFLDLRPRHFAWDAAEDRVVFFPSGLWYEPDPEFRRRVQALYSGFYQGDRAALALGLQLYGWQSQPHPGFSERIEQLLKEHFGSGEQSCMRFSVAHFRATFDRIFAETARSKAKLHPELTFLGVGLVGLYLTLERLTTPLDPRHAFEASVRQRGGPEAA